jgi:hypothetical protein
MGFNSHCARQKFERSNARYESIATVWLHARNVRCTPGSRRCRESSGRLEAVHRSRDGSFTAVWITNGAHEDRHLAINPRNRDLAEKPTIEMKRKIGGP